MLRIGAVFFCGALFAVDAGARAAAPAEMNELLPHDTLAFLEIHPVGGPGAGSLELGLKGLAALGVVPGEAGDVASLAEEAGRHASCVALLDADLKAGAKGELVCGSVQVVWLIRTEKPQEMVERITGVLSHFSTQATAKQTVEKTETEKGETGKEYVEFRDSRWPAWVKLDWAYEADGAEAGAGAVAGGIFVMALGDGAMEHFLSGRPVGDVPWKELAEGADGEAVMAGFSGGGYFFARGYVSAAGFETRFGDAYAHTPLGGLFAAIDLKGAGGAVFAARILDRELAMFSASAAGGKIAVTPWTVRVPAGAAILRCVPADASMYAVCDVPWEKAFARAGAMADVFLISAGDAGGAGGAAVRTEDFAKAAGVDLRGDLLERLEPLVVVHDSPGNPLGRPVPMTRRAAARRGQQQQYRGPLEKLGGAMAAAMSPAPGAGDVAGAGANWGALKIGMDSDGTRFLKMGLAGPAWGWADETMILSWSPAAVRENKAAGGKVSSAAFSKDSP